MLRQINGSLYLAVDKAMILERCICYWRLIGCEINMAVFSEHHASDLIFGSPRGNCSVVFGTLRVEVSVRAADSAAFRNAVRRG